MSDEEYNKRPNTYRAFKLQTEKQLISESHNAETEYPASTVEGIHEGDRCEVSRRKERHREVGWRAGKQ